MYEPILENFELLCRNLDTNCRQNVTPHRAAVVGTPRPVRIYMTPPGHEATGSHSMHADFAGGDHRYEEPPVTTLPAIFERNGIGRCDLLKVDCEGAEFEIFEHTPSEIFKRIDRIVMEYHTHTRSATEKHRQAAPLLERLIAEGFRIDDYLDSIGFRSGFLRARRV